MEGVDLELPQELGGTISVDLVVHEGAIEAVLEQVGGYRAVREPGRVVVVADP